MGDLGVQDVTEESRHLGVRFTPFGLRCNPYLETVAMSTIEDRAGGPWYDPDGDCDAILGGGERILRHGAGR
jgi:hypothetical protein